MILNRILRLLFIIILGGGILYIGTQTYPKFAHDIEMKNPIDVFSGNTANTTTDDTDPNSPDIDVNLPKVTLPKLRKIGLSFNLSGNGALLSFNRGISKEDFEQLVLRLRISDPETKQPFNKLRFTNFENKLFNNMDRNSYAWSISKHLIKNDTEGFAYKDPYTGLVIKTKDKLTHDFIIPLEYVWYHGGYNWPDEKVADFINDITIGLSTNVSSIRSKDEQGLEGWHPIANLEDYCWTFLNICVKYDISVTRADYNFARLQIFNALDSKEVVDIINRTTFDDVKQ